MISKSLFTLLLLFTLVGVSYGGGCTTETIILPSGEIIICTTCCTGGYCTTSCT